MNAVDCLIRIVPPPKPPIEAGDEEHLHSVEAMLSLELPSDYKRLILAYGTGCWQDFWYILNPNTPNAHLNFIVQSQCLRPNGWSTLDAERMTRSKLGEYPHAIYPEPGGILAWATTDNGGRFYWLTTGEPDEWPTIYYADRSPDYRTYNMSSAEIVLGAVSGSLPVFMDEFSPEAEYGRADSFVPKKF